MPKTTQSALALAPRFFCPQCKILATPLGWGRQERGMGGGERRVVEKKSSYFGQLAAGYTGPMCYSCACESDRHNW